jgi:magnesium-transporting ATPase (P-type)
MLRSQPWYIEYESGPVVDLEDLQKYSAENSVLSFVGLWQLMIASIVASIDQPFRKPWYKNPYHLLAFLGQFIFLMFIMFSPDNAFLESIQIKPLDSGFCGLILVLVIANLVCSLFLNWLSTKLKFILRN